ncbi:hypothetical protein ONZ51_g3246 [Trametes cubensis]|uniref:Protein kinase domain-containing protein n=1 Tax=Trametes cubensis TaxID=1111947 RepID=A0AAD7TYM3_9APHY|nr:hypothetical protein ONZ51_g3246 [Trametes cubensis]
MFSARSLVRRLRAWTRHQLRPPLPPRPPSTAKAPIIDPSELVEEERIPWYNPTDFYPVRIGEVFRSRYQVVGKLGYGGYSTVWLCRDLVEHCHVAVKVFSQFHEMPAKREMAAFKHLSGIQSDHPGQRCIRTCLDHFELPADHLGLQRPFQCLVLKPTLESVWDLRMQGVAHQFKFPQMLVKAVLRYVLLGLAYLHQEANMVHADIQEKNILFSIGDPASLEAFEEAVWTSPSPQKEAGDRTIYISRPVKLKTNGGLVLGDFGEARFGQTTYTDLIQPEPYRAPEVMLGMPWDEKVDIWSVGTMIWDMFQDKHMFRVPSGLDYEGKMRHRMAHIVSLLGPPPVDFLKRSETEEPWKYFDAQGNWTGAVDLPKDSLELSEQRLQGENKAHFLRFVRRMVAWRPEDRSPAHELLEDPWLQAQDDK